MYPRVFYLPFFLLPGFPSPLTLSLPLPYPNPTLHTPTLTLPFPFPYPILSYPTLSLSLSLPYTSLSYPILPYPILTGKVQLQATNVQSKKPLRKHNHDTVKIQII